jgi:hypothetical protein
MIMPQPGIEQPGCGMIMWGHGYAGCYQPNASMLAWMKVAGPKA